VWVKQTVERIGLWLVPLPATGVAALRALPITIFASRKLGWIPPGQGSITSARVKTAMGSTRAGPRTRETQCRAEATVPYTAAHVPQVMVKIGVMVNVNGGMATAFIGEGLFKCGAEATRPNTAADVREYILQDGVMVNVNGVLAIALKGPTQCRAEATVP